MSQILIGNDFWKHKNENLHVPIYFDLDEISNHHIGVAGTSGAGKTHWMRRFIESMPEDIEVDIFDYHGDIEIPVAETVIFSEKTRYGFNPLVLNPDHHYGGVRRAVNDVIEAINTTSRKLGTNQESVLRNLLTDTYAIKGIYADKPDTWIRNEATDEEIRSMLDKRDWRGLCSVYPSLHEVIGLAKRKLRALWMGIEDKQDGKATLSLLDEYCRTMQSFNRIRNKMLKTSSSDQETLDKYENKLNDLRLKTSESFVNFVNNIKSGQEFEELIKYNSKDVLLSLINRLENLNATGIFNANPPPFGNARIRRYYLKPLAQSDDELKMFVRFRIRSIIREMMQKGESGGQLKRLIVIDESKRFSDEEITNPLNIVVNEMRKFGLGLMLASQSPAHFSTDFIKNAGTLLLLNLATSDWDEAARKLKIETKDLKYLKPQDTGAIRMIEKRKTSMFKQVKF